MNKYLITLTSVLILSSTISSAAVINAQQVKGAYDAALASAFNNDGAIGKDKKLNPNGVNACYKAAADIKSFVDSNSKNLVGMKDTLLNKTAAQVERITMDAINNMKIIRNMPLTAIDKQLNVFTQLLGECSNAIIALQKENFTISAKKEAKDVLMSALTALQGFIRGDKVAMELAQELA